ncbi:Variant-specific surface protein [Giardia duodenalis]|uniref:Variant-specific surface protein n=1 Tax=Giardia intestinalis TaxID=5741 RepID=V6TWW7_GIAIN|nr:Variant-specific surface protein [Giardia intestinalis]
MSLTGVSIDSLRRPSSSPQAITAGCTGSDGAALTDSSTACESCSGGFFLFRGGCYSTKSNSGSEICTKAEGGKCTTCKTDNGLFKNPADAPTLGSECILCWDTTGADGYKGVENCNKCAAPGNAGAATCSACQDGYYKDDKGTCQKCDQTCATCSGTGQNACTSCPEGKYLKDGNTCVDGTSNSCGANSYADKRTWTCKACSEIAGCTACAYNDNLQLPICSACDSGKVVRTELDGSTTCITVASDCTDENHFKTDGNAACLLCNDITTGAGTASNVGVEHCKTCQKTADNQNPTCTTCQDGYIKNNGGSACESCGSNCATCTKANDMSTCSKCLPGYFLRTGSPNECVLCGDTAKGGIEGCAECSGTAGSLKCTKCKPTRKPKGDSGNYTCEEKTCEDDSACGGTAGACGAIVVGSDGSVKYYCSQCRQQ